MCVVCVGDPGIRIVNKVHELRGGGHRVGDGDGERGGGTSKINGATVRWKQTVGSGYDFLG